MDNELKKDSPKKYIDNGISQLLQNLKSAEQSGVQYINGRKNMDMILIAHNMNLIPI